MDLSWGLGLLGIVVGTIFDVLAFPATWVISRLGITDLGLRLVVACVVTLAAWLVVASLLFGVLRLAAVSFELLLPALCRTGDLESIRSTVRAVYRLCSFLYWLAFFFRSTGIGIGPSPTRDYFSDVTGPRQPHMALRVVRLLLRIPYGLVSFVRQFVRALLSVGGFLFLITVVWAVFGRSASFWAEGADFVLRSLDFISQRSVVALVPVVLLLLAIVSTARVRGAYTWRTEKFKHAYAALDALSHKAEPLRSNLHDSIRDLADIISRRAVSEVTAALTCQRGLWEGKGVVTFPAPELGASHGRLRVSAFRKPGPPWHWADRRPVLAKSASLSVSLRDLETEYQEECASKNLGNEVNNIAPRNVRKFLREIQWRSRYSPIGEHVDATVRENHRLCGVDLQFLSLEGMEAYVISWLDRQEEIRSKYGDILPEGVPDEALRTETTKALAGLVNELRKRLVRACWLEEQLDELVNIGWTNRYPSGLVGVWQSIKGR